LNVANCQGIPLPQTAPTALFSQMKAPQALKTEIINPMISNLQNQILQRRQQLTAAKI
jgi:alpha-D-ribose 1-methylphosphonate 5-triphosphate synthase subunit PhnG